MKAETVDSSPSTERIDAILSDFPEGCRLCPRLRKLAELSIWCQENPSIARKRGATVADVKRFMGSRTGNMCPIGVDSNGRCGSRMDTSR